MTLSLDDVRNKRFRMARKSGYEVLEVDEFVDEVEAAFEQLLDENANLKKQVESLSSASAPSAAAAPAGRPEPRPSAPSEPRAAQPIVVTTGKEASSAVVRLVEMSTEQAERLVREATEDANRIREEASRGANQVTTDARTHAERIESEARVSAERMQSDALSRAEALDRDIDARRVEMFGALERERDELASAVSQLREFEAGYRSNLTTQLRQHIATLEQQKGEPDNSPALANRIPAAEPRENGAGNRTEPRPQVQSPAEPDRDGEPTLGGGSSTSDTPRLDALLGDQH